MDSLENNTIPLVFMRTKTLRKERQRRARNWEYSQYDVKPFSNAVLQHKDLKYSVWQYQTEQGHKFVHGLLRFTKQTCYSAVHELVGGGDYCDITVPRIPALTRTQCMDTTLDHAPQILGTFHNLRKKRPLKPKKKKKHVRKEEPVEEELDPEDALDAEDAHSKSDESYDEDSQHLSQRKIALRDERARQQLLRFAKTVNQ